MNRSTRFSRHRVRLSLVVVVSLVIAVAAWLNSSFLGEFSVAEEVPQAPLSSPAADDVRSSLTEEATTSGKSRPKGTGRSRDAGGLKQPASSEAPINRDEWKHSIRRGVVLDMYNLTQLNDCKRLPSWRANEKRFIRLQNDRSRKTDCIRTAGLNHTQLFGLRAVADTTPLSHHQYEPYEHERDSNAPDEPRLYRLAREYVAAATSTGGDLRPDDLREAQRLFSLAAVVTSPSFLWEKGSEAPEPQTFQDLIDSGRLRIAREEGSRYHGLPEINPEELAECPFSKLKSLSHKDMDPFSVQGYHLVQFLFEETFLRHGWITVPVAGTALGTLRHHGMFRGDDDMDMATFPPAQYLLLDSEWTTIYSDFDDLVENYGTLHRDFQWFRSNDYGIHRSWFTRNDVKKKLPAFRFVEYEAHIRQDGRVCFAQYMTWNMTEKRRLFQTEGCTPNHWFLCLQPASYVYNRHDEVVERHIIQDVHDVFYPDPSKLREHLDDVGPMLFTAFHRRPVGKLCKCKFGFRHPSMNTESFGICPSNLFDLVQYWYDAKWCVPSGAVRTRKWSFLKSWND